MIDMPGVTKNTAANLTHMFQHLWSCCSCECGNTSLALDPGGAALALSKTETPSIWCNAQVKKNFFLSNLK